MKVSTPPGPDTLINGLSFITDAPLALVRRSTVKVLLQNPVFDGNLHGYLIALNSGHSLDNNA